MPKLLDRTTTYKFSNRFVFLLSALGIAVGTGNIWRFPRIVALSSGDNGAASFFIVWLLFLFIWSIPIIIMEYYLGYKYKRSIMVFLIKFSVLIEFGSDYLYLWYLLLFHFIMQ